MAARLEHILVGVDLHHGDRVASESIEDATQAALTQAVELAHASGAKLTLCGVLDISEQAHHLIELDVANIHKTVEDVARTALARLADRVRSEGLTVDAVVRFGHAGDELVRQVLQGHHDLVVVGTRKRNAAARMLFGSTSQRLIRLCPVPVWIAKPGEVREVREMLVASDFSEAADAATRTAVQIAQAIGAKLFVVHALEFPFEAYLRTAGVAETEVHKYRSRLHSEAHENLKGQLEKTDYRTLPHGVKVDVIEGQPDDVVPRFITENEVDLLVIGTFARHGLAGIILGNTAERLLPAVHASLLVVKPASFVCPLAAE
jgi:universal stress protein E